MHIFTLDNTATGSHPLLVRTNYHSTSRVFQFLLYNANSQCLDINIMNDNLVEDMDRFTLYLTTTNYLINLM